MFSDSIDSHYQWVKARILTMNPNRVMAGLLDAQDWPPKPFKNDAFYLLVMPAVPVGKQGYSASTPIKLRSVQWAWGNTGTDLKPGVRQANRGDRFRIMEQMSGELIFGCYPGFAEKLNWSLQSTGNPPPNDNQWTGTPKTPPEFITWTPVEIQPKWNKEAGVGFGYGSLRITDMTDTITS